MEVYVKLELCLYILLCLKRNLMYANSTRTNYPVAKSIVTSEMVTTTEGSTLMLKCPPSSSNRTTWKKSPPTDCRFTQYAENNKINPSLEHANRLRVVGNFSIGIYNLQILNVSLVDEGLYRCSYTNNNTSHTKGIRVSLKSNLMYANSTGPNYPVAKSIVTSEMVTTTEGSTLMLKCPPSSSNRTTWKKSPPTDCRFTQYAENNKINPSLEHANRLRVVGNFSIGIYNLQILNVSLVDEGLYRCSYINNNTSHTKGIRVSLKSNLMYANSTGTNYPVAKSIVTSEMVTTTEGSTLILKCPPSSSRHKLWEKSPLTDFNFTHYAEDDQINPSLEHANRLRVVGNFRIGIYNLQILNVSLVDEGLYRCSYTNNKISHTKGIRVSLKTKPPEVNVIAVSHFGKIRLDCLARGIPASYTFFRWEHKSMFGEHIRYLDGFDNGTLLIQNKSNLERYQNNGLYVCHVSNGIFNSNGMVVQMGEYVLKVESQPVFAMQTQRTQFGVDGQMASLIFHLYGYPHAKEVSVFPADDKTEIIQINEFKIKNATVLESFHDVVIHAIGYTINFEFDRLNETDAQNYTIIAYNSQGRSKFDFEIIPASVEEHKTSEPSLPNIVLLTSIVAGIVVFVIPTIIIYRTYLKKNEKESADVEEVQMNVINQGIGPVENALYQSHDLQRNTRSSATYSTMEGRGKSQTGHSVVSYSTADSDSNGDIFSGGATNLHSKQPPMDLPDKDIGLSLSATGYNTPKDLLREQEHFQARQAKQFNNKELQYSELSFNPSSGPIFIIHGKNDKTVYSDVDLSIRVSPLPFADKDSDSDDKDDDFMYIDNIKKYTMKRSKQAKLNTK